ncbi:MAG: hypothetical protein J5I93_16460, partial [Pirellulaceae bacterium]|nr:hypothetical protein [Pirellulaceae bacterium]
DKLGTHDVWVLEGTWKPAQLVRLLPDQKPLLLAGQLPSGELLPPHLPQHVRLVLGRDPIVPLFPYRIEYLRQESADESASPGGAGEWQTLLVVEFFEIRRVPLVPQQFQYDPGDHSIVDETDLYLERRGLAPAKASG